MSKRPVCRECGSTDVKADAWAEWDETKGDWVLSQYFESTAICEDCGGECSLEYQEPEQEAEGLPKWTIEQTFDVPHYRRITVEAATLQEAIEIAEQDDNWDSQKADFENSSPIRVSGAWAGNQDYSGPNLAPLP